MPCGRESDRTSGFWLVADPWIGACLRSRPHSPSFSETGRRPASVALSVRKMIDHLFAVVLAGGSGTRFWPASRKARPKQLLAIGPTELTLIAATVRRIDALCPPERTLIATGVHLLARTREALPWLPHSSFMGEPIPKNTAPCIAWASWEAERRDPEAIVMVLPSDHHI